MLNLTYPNGNASSTFVFIVDTFEKDRTIADWSDVQGLTVNVSGNANMTYNLTFAGEYGGAWRPINDFEYWNFTYSMPEGFIGTPNLCLEVELW